MKCIRVLSVLLALALIMQGGAVFGDEAYGGASAWAAAELDKAAGYGLITEKIKDKMNAPISREEFAELAVRLYEKTRGVKAVYTEEDKFSDTKNEEIYKAYNLKIVKGTDMGKRLFSPNQLTDREQVAAMLYRTIQAIDPSTDFSTDGVTSFSDQNVVSSWALESLRYMYKSGFLKGSGGKIDPKGSCTREMAVIIASRILEKNSDMPGMPPATPTGASPGTLSGTAPQNLPGSNALLECNWELRVNDTKKGKYQTPMGTIETDVTVDLVAWKNGGTDILGKYHGEAYITHKVDVSKLSNDEYMYFGGAMFDRKCEKLEFEIVPYDWDEYSKHIMIEPNKIPVAPLMQFHAMANFMADFSSYKDQDVTVINRDDGYSYNAADAYGDNATVPVGFNFRIEGLKVKVEIPTYSTVWGTGFFDGTIIGEPIK